MFNIVPRTETSKKKKKKKKKNCGPNWGWNELFYSNFVECLLKQNCKDKIENLFFSEKNPLPPKSMLLAKF